MDDPFKQIADDFRRVWTPSSPPVNLIGIGPGFDSPEQAETAWESALAGLRNLRENRDDD